MSLQKNLLCFLTIGISFFQPVLGQESPYAIAAGRGLPSPFPIYATFIDSSGALTDLASPFQSTIGLYNSVSMNHYGTSIISTNDSAVSLGYAAYISSSGDFTQITGEVPPAASTSSFNSVSINNSGVSLAGGGSTSEPWLVQVSPSAVATRVDTGLTSGNGTYLGVSITDEGRGIAVGSDQGSSTPFALLISASGNATRLSGTGAPVANGNLNACAINESFLSLIGGSESGNTPYSAFISSSGAFSKIEGPGSPQSNGTGRIQSVALNQSGLGIIGGSNFSPTRSYIAFVSPDGTILEIPAVTGKTIFSVAINESGQAVVGGVFSSNAYAALVSPSGTLTELSGSGMPLPGLQGGTINSVAIDDSGIALIGGFDNRQLGSDESLYLALVAPSGVTTRLSSTAIGEGIRIESLSLARALSSSSPILSFFVPGSFGPGNSFAFPLFAVSSKGLSNHLALEKVLTIQANQKELVTPLQAALISRIENSIDFDWEDCEEPTSNEAPPLISLEKKHSLWLSIFADRAHEETKGSSPGAKSITGGVLLGFDYSNWKRALLGLAAAYAYSDVTLSQSLGKAKINQELLSPYFSYSRKYFSFNLALWGGLYQIDNKRNSGFGIVSTSDIQGWIFLPHLEVSFPFCTPNSKFFLDPFVMLDFLNNWQNKLQEKGSSGLNLILQDQYSSFLRTEAGFRFFESFDLSWGTFVLKEKVSFVNKQLLRGASTTTSFVGSTSSFGIELFSGQTENLAAFQVGMSFISNQPKPAYCSLNYQGEVGSSSLNHFGSLEIGKKF